MAITAPGEVIPREDNLKLHLLNQRKQWPIGDYEEDAVLIFGYLEGAVDVSGRGIEKHTFACLLAGLSIDQRALHNVDVVSAGVSVFRLQVAGRELNQCSRHAGLFVHAEQLSCRPGGRRRDEAYLIKNPLYKFFKNLIALTTHKSCLTNPQKKYSQIRFIFKL